MRKIITLLFLSHLCFLLNAQQVQEIASNSYEEAIPNIKSLLGNKLPDQIKLVGLGEVATLAKESQQFNIALMAYLIRRKKFRHLILDEDEWRLRRLNNYLISNRPLDTIHIDSLVRYTLQGNELKTTHLKSFIIWIKQFNLASPDSMVKIFGVLPEAHIPPSYFFKTYISPLDAEYGKKLIKKGDQKEYTESEAYQDIEFWINNFNSSHITAEQKALISMCKADIAHNKAIKKITSFDQQLSTNEIDLHNTYISNRIIEKTDDKAIYYGLNLRVFKGDYTATYISGNRAIASVGKKLHAKLKAKYYACITDFSDSAYIPLVDYKARKARLEKISGSEQAKKLALKKDHFFSTEDQKVMKWFVPTVTPFFKGRSETMILDDLTPADALFIFSNLTEADLRRDK